MERTDIAQDDALRKSKGVCEACIMAKMTRLPFKLSNRKTSYSGELVFIDIIPLPVIGSGAFKYFVTFLTTKLSSPPLSRRAEF